MEKPWLRNYDPGVPHTLEYPRIPLFQFLEESAQKYPDNTATIFLKRRMTYEEINDLADRTAAALHALGVEKGDRVALLLPNCPQFVFSYFGILKLGAIVVATNPLYTPREIAHQLNDAGAETVIVLSRLYPLVKKIQAQTRLKNIIVTNIKEYFPPVIRTLFTLFREKKDGHRVTLEPSDHWLQDLLAKYTPEQRPRVEVSPDDTAIFQYTGGTTGVPKGAMGSHFNLVANAIQIGYWFPNVRKGQEIVMGGLPFFHVYGQVTVLCFAPSVGAAMILIPNPREIDDVLKNINEFQPTLFPGAPFMYVNINNHPEISKYNIRSIRACISGSAPLPVEVKKKFEEITGGKLCEGYGLSEAPTASHCNPIMGKNVPGSIGLPFPDIEAKIVDLETGTRDLPVGEVGELVFRGPIVMKGYWNNPEETRQTLRDGWLYTGDIAKMDAEGYFYIVDRKKDLIIVSGENVYPREVEEVLYMHPKVQEAAVAGIPDPYRGETVKAWIVLKPEETATAEEIREFCKDKLAKFKIPREMEFRSELPKTLVGKVLRRFLRDEELQKRQTTASA